MSLFNLFNKPEKANQATYQVGQEWHFHTRSGEESATLKIVKTEEGEGGVIVHIYVSGIHLKKRNGQWFCRVYLASPAYRRSLAC